MIPFSLLCAAIEYLEHFLQGEMDLWAVAQHQPQFFNKGGAYYQQVFDQFGGQVKHNTHIQFKEFHEKVFAFNSEQERLELCLGESGTQVSKHAFYNIISRSTLRCIALLNSLTFSATVDLQNFRH